MTTTCDLAAQDMGTGVAAALTAVDCIASEVSEEAFLRLSEGPMGTFLPILLTFFVAFFGISLMLGRSNLSMGAVVPKMVTIGLVTAFATSFFIFQQFFYNIFVLGPDSIAGMLTGSEGSATATFATKLDIVFLAVQEASTGQQDINAFSPPGMMWLGAMLLLLGTVGLLVTARIGLALLLAVGPIFVVLALFTGTRGLFVGWLKGLVMLALAPLFAIVGGSIMLEIAVPILAALVAVPGQIDQQAAMAFFLVGAVHMALMFMVLKVSSNMVAGWQVFGLAVPDRMSAPTADAARMAGTTPRAVAAPAATARPQPTATTAGQRRIDVAVASSVPANDTGGNNTVTTRETKVYATGSGNAQSGSTGKATSRTRGIGNRFRTASTPGATPKSETKR